MFDHFVSFILVLYVVHAHMYMHVTSDLNPPMKVKFYCTCTQACKQMGIPQVDVSDQEHDFDYD